MAKAEMKSHLYGSQQGYRDLERHRFGSVSVYSPRIRWLVHRGFPVAYLTDS